MTRKLTYEYLEKKFNETKIVLLTTKEEFTNKGIRSECKCLYICGHEYTSTWENIRNRSRKKNKNEFDTNKCPDCTRGYTPPRDRTPYTLWMKWIKNKTTDEVYQLWKYNWCLHEIMEKIGYSKHSGKTTFTTFEKFYNYCIEVLKLDITFWKERSKYVQRKNKSLWYQYIRNLNTKQIKEIWINSKDYNEISTTFGYNLQAHQQSTTMIKRFRTYCTEFLKIDLKFWDERYKKYSNQKRLNSDHFVKKMEIYENYMVELFTNNIDKLKKERCNNNQVKKYLKEKYGMDKCQWCGRKNNEPLIVNGSKVIVNKKIIKVRTQLDHINGCHFDNLFIYDDINKCIIKSNIRILCSTCHVNTSTFCRGRGNIYDWKESKITVNGKEITYMESFLVEEKEEE